MLRVATVLSARDWESQFVEHARSAASVRLVLRAYQPADVEDAEDLDVVVVGAETSWVTAARLRTWRRRGLRVVGLHPPGDRPAKRMLEEAEADEIFSEDTPPQVLLQVVRLLRPAVAKSPSEHLGRLVVVAGPRGAPGRTEVALTVALLLAASARTALLDLDQEAPALAVRLGLPPRPDLADAIEAVRGRGFLPRDQLHQWAGVDVVVGSHRPGEREIRAELMEEVVEAARTSHIVTVVDTGPLVSDLGLVKRADDVLLVCEGSAIGLVRVAQTIAGWAGPPPDLVVNKVDPAQEVDVTAAARKWTGLEPAAVIKDHPSIRTAARAARPPDRVLRRALTRAGVVRA